MAGLFDNDTTGGPGIWTTEFWSMWGKALIGALVAGGVLAQTKADEMNGQLTMLFTSLGYFGLLAVNFYSYAASRGTAKAATAANPPPIVTSSRAAPLAIAFGILAILFCSSPVRADAVIGKPGHYYAHVAKTQSCALLPWRSNIENLLQQIATNISNQKSCPDNNSAAMMALQQQLSALNSRLDQIASQAAAAQAAMLARPQQQIQAPYPCPCPQSVKNGGAGLPSNGLITIPAPPVVIHQSPPYYIPPLGAPVNPAPLGTQVQPAPLGLPVTPAPLGLPVQPAPLGLPVPPAPLGPSVAPAPLGPSVTPNPLGQGTPAVPPSGIPSAPPGLGAPAGPPPVGPPSSMQRLVPAQSTVRWYWAVTDREYILICEKQDGTGTIVQRQPNDGSDPKLLANCEVWRLYRNGAQVRESR